MSLKGVKRNKGKMCGCACNACTGEKQYSSAANAAKGKTQHNKNCKAAPALMLQAEIEQGHLNRGTMTSQTSFRVYACNETHAETSVKIERERRKRRRRKRRRRRRRKQRETGQD